MNLYTKMESIKLYMVQTETTIQRDLINDMRELTDRRISIEERYSEKKQKAIVLCQQKKDRMQEVCEKAKQLIDGIKRKLYKKQNRTLQNVDLMHGQISGDALIELEHEIEKFERTSLPFGVRQFIDGVCLLFNSNYGQDDVDRINALYLEIKRVQDNDELDKELNNELSKIEEEQIKEIYIIDRMMSSIVRERVEDYIYSLKEKIFAV